MNSREEIQKNIESHLFNGENIKALFQSENPNLVAVTNFRIFGSYTDRNGQTALTSTDFNDINGMSTAQDENLGMLHLSIKNAERSTRFFNFANIDSANMAMSLVAQGKVLYQSEAKNLSLEKQVADPAHVVRSNLGK